MSKATSAITAAHASPDPGLSTANYQHVRVSVEEPKDYLGRLPVELRLVIFAELLTVWPEVVFRGGNEFGNLDDNEFPGEMIIPWQIMLTCRKYNEECTPILYGNNRLIFYTVEAGSPGMFWRFPVKIKFMHYLTDLGIYFRADSPDKPAAKRIALFIESLILRAKKLEYLTVLIASDRRTEKQCPWDILFCDHPVARALVRLVEAKTVKHLKIRVHDGARVFPGFASFLSQTFHKGETTKSLAGRSITFTESCTCVHVMTIGFHGPLFCMYCAWPHEHKHLKPVENVVPPSRLESGHQRMMDMQHELFELGILPLRDDDGDVKGKDDSTVGPYGGGSPVEDAYEETKKAFDSGLLLPGQVRRWRGGLVKPKEWSFKQTKVKDYFKCV